MSSVSDSGSSGVGVCDCGTKKNSRYSRKNSCSSSISRSHLCNGEVVAGIWNGELGCRCARGDDTRVEALVSRNRPEPLKEPRGVGSNDHS